MTVAKKKLHGVRLSTERYHSLVGLLREWRIDPGIQELERLRKKGRILGFVRGLRFSSQLIYALRVVLSGKNVEIDWAHILDKPEKFCSPECDIVIHRPGYAEHWNGSSDPVMDFKFVRSEDAIAVISCKSFLRQIDKPYPGDMKKFCKRVFLFSECCPTNSLAKLTADAKAAGYAGFWSLYTMNTKTTVIQDDDSVWVDFITMMKAECK